MREVLRGLRGAAPASSAGPAARATITCWSRWSSTPTRRNWCSCSGKATTASSSTPRLGPALTWIDLNCPFHGTRHEELAGPGRAARAPPRAAQALRRPGRRPGGRAGAGTAYQPAKPLPAEAAAEAPAAAASPVPGWPFDAAEAAAASRRPAPVTRRRIDLGGGEAIELVLIPRGRVRHGQRDRADDERPLARAGSSGRSGLATCEITNRQYDLFDPAHDSRVESKNATQYGIQGYPVNLPEQPVVRVSWHEAMAFCRWLSERRAGSSRCRPRPSGSTPAAPAPPRRSSTATRTADFSRWPTWPTPSWWSLPATCGTTTAAEEPDPLDEWFPKDARFNDGALLTVAPGPLPAQSLGPVRHARQRGRVDAHRLPALSLRPRRRPRRPGGAGRKVVRGGSWRDRPSAPRPASAWATSRTSGSSTSASASSARPN